ncbi:hypothetical protein [Nocardia sp. NPDC003979]
MLWMTIRPGTAVQEAAAVEPQTTSTVEPDPIAAAAAFVEPEPAPVSALDESATLSMMHATTPCDTEWKGVRPHVAQVSHLLQKMFGISDIGGAHGRYDGDHGAGLALDVMTSGGVGDAIAEFVLANKERFGVTYVIWKQRYNDGGGWSFMEDRGSPTQNHYDHVHISFESSGATNISC